jgi:hypothetical protein
MVGRGACPKNALIVDPSGSLVRFVRSLACALLLALGGGVACADDITACLHSYNNREMAILGTLSIGNQLLLSSLKTKEGAPACAFQKKLLDALGDFPREQRDEEFAGFVDKLTGR